MLKRALCWLWLGLSIPGCVIAIDDDDRGGFGRGYGTLTAEWTVDGSTHPDACWDFGARDFELVVYARRDYDTEVEVPCDDFVVAVDVPEGRYSIDATLVDRADRSVTTTLALDDIYVYAGEELIVPIDFPPDSLL